MRTMLRCLVVILVTTSAVAEEPSSVSSAGLLRVRGQVVRPDGTPAAGATITVLPDLYEAVQSATADTDGRFEAEGIFGNGLRLSAASSDQTQQSSVWIAAPDVRNVGPLRLELVPSAEHPVRALRNGQPVPGVQVVATGFAFQSRAMTDGDGRAVVRYPANDSLRELVAWHPTQGIAGVRESDDYKFTDHTELELSPPEPCRLRVMDPDGQPVADLSLGVSFRVHDTWILTQQVVEAQLRTDRNGEVVVPWAPSGALEGLDVELMSRQWKIDASDRQAAERSATIRVRPRQLVEGKVTLPSGENPAGLLITGFAFGPDHNGDIPRARVRADGTFTLSALSDHGYVVGIADSEWESDLWTGMIGDAEIALKAYEATPLVVKVTRGADNVPIAGAFVEVDSEGKVEWTYGTEKRVGTGGVRYWLRTDDTGLARAGIGRGKYSVRLSSGTWGEEQAIEVASQEPIHVRFHRAWLDERQITGMLTHQGAAYQSTAEMVAHAWSYRNGRWRDDPPQFDQDGRFVISADAEELTVLFLDSGLSGFAKLTNKSAVEIEMQASAKYVGTLVDDQGPLAGRELQLSVYGIWSRVLQTTTDDAGRFAFENVPADVPLILTLGVEELYLDDSKRLFEPGEVRDDRVIVRRAGERARKPDAPVKDRLAALGRDAALSHMRGLVVVGDESDDLVETILDHERHPAILNYLPMRVVTTEAKEQGWSLPANEQVVLVVLDADARVIESMTVSSDQLSQVPAFLERHALPKRDAIALLDDAKRLAAETHRRIWLVRGGPRCGPCIRLARWLDLHHEVLERDYVIVKLIDVIDDRVSEAMQGYCREDCGIPFHAILEPDGMSLVTSEGPLGNIGMPSSVEGIRHLRKMLETTARNLTGEEIERLIASLDSEP